MKPVSKLGPGFIGLLADVVQALQWARAYGLRPSPVPALRSNLGYCTHKHNRVSLIFYLPSLELHKRRLKQ